MPVAGDDNWRPVWAGEAIGSKRKAFMLLIQWEAASKRAATLRRHAAKVQAHPWIKKVAYK